MKMHVTMINDVGTRVNFSSCIRSLIHMELFTLLIDILPRQIPVRQLK
jgi:hypothetical protein